MPREQLGTLVHTASAVATRFDNQVDKLEFVEQSTPYGIPSEAVPSRGIYAQSGLFSSNSVPRSLHALTLGRDDIDLGLFDKLKFAFRMIVSGNNGQIASRLPVTNCQRRLAAKLKFDNTFK